MLKKYSLLTLVFFLSFFVSCSETIVEPKEVRELTQIEKNVVSSSEEFGLNLFRKINEFEGDKNIFISPLSISMALGMALNGAAGETYTAMQSTLELSSLSSQEINEAYKSLIELLTQIDPKVQFQIANSIWYKNTITFEKQFIDLNKTYFNAEVEGLNFSDQNSVKTINSWVDKSTNGKIKSILEKIPDEAIMYLINAIYFKGTWQYEFKKSETIDDLFTLSNGKKVNCEMMVQTNDKFRYFSNSNFQAVDLRYGSGDFSMTIFLPNWDKTEDVILEQLNKENWNLWINSFTESQGTIQLPKFELEYKYNLNDVLKALGMEISFSENADFTNLYKPGGVFISNVEHKTYVKVDEEGTEAAAVTSVEFGATSIGGGFVMRMDRPFIYIIRESNSGSILFMGKIVKPN